MRKNPALFWLSTLVIILAVIVTAAGVFWPREGSAAATFTTVHGREVELYGEGLYRNDSAFRAPVLIGTDTVTLFVFVPLLALCLYFYRRGSLRAGLLLGFVLTVLNAMVGLMVILQTALQIINRVNLTGGQMIAYVTPFVVLAGFASVFIVRYLRCLSTPPASGKMQGHSPELA